MAQRTCSIDDCDRSHYARGWCFLHYKRWHRKGDTRLTPPPPRRSCTIADCDRPHKARGMCLNHYQRWLRGSDPTVDRPRSGPGSPRWVGREDLDYNLAHERVKYVRGSASLHACVACGDAASDWAYQHTDPDPLVDTRPGRSACEYSDDIWTYEPMCKACHNTMDAERRAGRIYEEETA